MLTIAQRNLKYFTTPTCHSVQKQHLHHYWIMQKRHTCRLTYC